MRVLVTGGRSYADRTQVYQTLGAIDRIDGISQIIEGCADGADRLAEQWARDAEVMLRHFPVTDWHLPGGKIDRSAGVRRNQRMLIEGLPELVVAFPGGRGTADMVRRARRAGVPVREVARA